MKTSGEMSYGQEWLATAAGPVSNLLLAVVIAAFGRRWEPAYLFAGAQAVLGVFNLLPIAPLDGSVLLWILLAVASDPYAADRWRRRVGAAAALVLWIGCGVLLVKCGSFFPLLAAFPLLYRTMREIGLVKPRGKR